MKHFTMNTLDHNTAVNKDESILEAKIIYSNLCPLADLWRHHMNDPQVPEKWSPDHRLCFLLLLNVEMGFGSCSVQSRIYSVSQRAVGHPKKKSLTICL